MDSSWLRLLRGKLIYLANGVGLDGNTNTVLNVKGVISCHHNTYSYQVTFVFLLVPVLFACATVLCGE